jgi:hypothetical protein
MQHVQQKMIMPTARSSKKVANIVFSFLVAEVRAALDAVHLDRHNFLFDECDIPNTRKLLTFMTSVVSNLASSPPLDDIIGVSSSQLPSLCQFLRMLNNGSRSVNHIIIQRGAGVDAYLAACDFVHLRKLQRPTQGHSSEVRTSSRDHLTKGKISRKRNCNQHSQVQSSITLRKLLIHLAGDS